MSVKDFKKIVDQSKHILIIQADNPDGDSLSSTLALEDIFGEMDKKVTMYCKVNMPQHLRHLSGWDRVVDQLPTDFDASIIVDTSSKSLLDTLFVPENMKLLKSKPMIIIDHHETDSDIEFATEVLIDKDAVATGEMICMIAHELGWDLTTQAQEFLASSIMYDSLGLSTESTTPRSIRLVADLVENGVSLAKLDSLRRQSMVRALDLTHYKGRLLSRIELLVEGSLAYIHIPWEEIQEYSDKYNPSMLVIEDMRLTEGVKVAVALKSYPDGKITGKFRSNYGYPVSNKVAERFGGGGHPYAAGFKVTNLTLEEVRKKLQQYVHEELENEATQHPDKEG